MRPLFLVLLLANLVFFAAQFDVVRHAVLNEGAQGRPPQIGAERLRIIRDTSVRTPPLQPRSEPAS